MLKLTPEILQMVAMALGGKHKLHIASLLRLVCKETQAIMGDLWENHFNQHTLVISNLSEKEIALEGKRNIVAIVIKGDCLLQEMLGDSSQTVWNTKAIDALTSWPLSLSKLVSSMDSLRMVTFLPPNFEGYRLSFEDLKAIENRFALLVRRVLPTLPGGIEVLNIASAQDRDDRSFEVPANAIDTIFGLAFSQHLTKLHLKLSVGITSADTDAQDSATLIARGCNSLVSLRSLELQLTLPCLDEDELEFDDDDMRKNFGQNLLSELDLSRLKNLSCIGVDIVGSLPSILSQGKAKLESLMIMDMAIGRPDEVKEATSVLRDMKSLRYLKLRDLVVYSSASKVGQLVLFPQESEFEWRANGKCSRLAESLTHIELPRLFF